MSLFNLGEFRLHSGGVSRFKIDCDCLSDGDLAALAEIAARHLPKFFEVEGVPRGGLRFADALARHVDTCQSRVLICDDVLTTGRSMEVQRADRDAIGVVIFRRGVLPSWVKAVQDMWGVE